MSFKVKRKRKIQHNMTAMLGAATLCLAIVGSVVEGAEDDFKFLRKKYRETQKGSYIGSTGGVISSADTFSNMEDLWDHAVATARVELEAERLLIGTSSDFSMPSTPNRPPANPPTRQPALPPNGDCLQGRTREEYIFDLLIELTPGSILNDPSTPQGRAFSYLASDDPFLSDPCVSTTIQQRYGLTTMYYSLGGEAWLNSDGWLGDDQECLWFGIECLGGNPNVVTRITLSENNLVGRLPDEIKAVEALERFDVFANTVTGMIPVGISDLSRLVLLDVEQNFLSGQAFPSQLLDVQSLLAYRASNNFLSGSIPATIGQLNNLRQIWLATNQVTGTIPAEITSLTDLESLFLYQNLLTGTLPTELGSFTTLEDLRLYQNTIQNTIPSQLFDAVRLETLRLEFNFFSGTIPTEIGKLSALRDFQIDTNGLSGVLPSEIGNLVQLENLIINNNFLSGQIPDVFQNLNNLDYADAANNQFFGSIPESIFDASALRLLYLSNNTLSGTIPPTFSKPVDLRDLYLDGNSLIGTVPEVGAGTLQNLNEFLVHFNFLSGSIPASICDLVDAGTLEDVFSDCGGDNPEILCDFPSCCNRCFEGGSLARRLNMQGETGRDLLR